MIHQILGVVKLNEAGLTLEYTPGMLQFHVLPIPSGVGLESTVAMITFELAHSQLLLLLTFLLSQYSRLSEALFIMGLKLLLGKIFLAGWAINHPG